MASARLATSRRLTSTLRRPQTTRTFATASPAQVTSPFLRTGIYATAFAVSAGLFAVYYLDSRSALHRYFLTPALRYTLDAETGIKIALGVLRSGLGPRDPLKDDSRLEAKLWDMTIPNPIGLAAGFDKNGEAIDGLFGLGFSWVEIGSVTPKPQPGNPKPRVFHLPEDSGLINRYGFPSEGHSAMVSRLRARIPAFYNGSTNASLKDGSVLAVNLGKNKDSPTDSIEDFVTGVKTFGTYADVLVINVSSPNTPGLRGLQNREVLEELLKEVTSARDQLLNSSRRPKLVLKIAPDLNDSQLEDIAGVIRGTGVDGVIVSNTTIQRPSHLSSANKSEAGGLSGAPLKPLSLAALRTLRSRLPASVPLIGCGGIFTGADALEYAKAGASMVQVYTAFGYEGAGACRRIKDQLTAELAKEGKTWNEIVKEAVAELSYKEEKFEAKSKETGENRVKQLIEEAEELKRMLEKLGEDMDLSSRIKDEKVKVGNAPAAAVAAVV